MPPANLTRGARGGSPGKSVNDAAFRMSEEAANAEPGSVVDVRIRIEADDTAVSIGENQYVHTLKKKVLDVKNLSHLDPERCLRLFFFGRELANTTLLKDCPGVESDVVIIGYITTPDATPS